MLEVLKFIYIIGLLFSIIICFKGMKTKNVLYKGGFYFFVLLFVENVYSLIIPVIIRRLVDNEVNNIGIWVRNLSIPSIVLSFLSLIFFIAYLLKGLNKDFSN